MVFMSNFLQAINDILPRLAKEQMDAIISEAQDAQFKLEMVPASTTEFVSSLTFLDEIQERIDSLDEMSSIVVLMYDLIDKFKVPTPPEDFAVYQVGSVVYYCCILSQFYILSSLTTASFEKLDTACCVKCIKCSHSSNLNGLERTNLGQKFFAPVW